MADFLCRYVCLCVCMLGCIKLYVDDQDQYLHACQRFFLQSMHALLERERACMAGMHGSTQDRSKPRIQHAHVAAGSMLSEECTAALNLQVRFFFLVRVHSNLQVYI